MPPRRAQLAWALIAALAAALLAGCGPPSQPAGEPGGTLRWGLDGVTDITRLDPARLGGNQENVPIYLIFGGLVRINDRLEVVPEGAERWTVSDDGTVYTFYLRPNLKYGDGSPAIAQDFADAMVRTIAPDTGTDYALTFLANVIGASDVREGKADTLAGVRVLDERTLEITIDSPRAYFLSQLTYGLTYVVKPGSVEAGGEGWLDKAFGTGPFRVKLREPGKRLVLEGNPHYWAGTPGVSEVEFRYYPSTEVAFEAYKAGDVDIMGSVQAGVPAGRLGEARALPGFQTISSPVMRYIGFNNALPPFNNVYVRQAFAQGVDKDTLARQTLGGTVAAAGRILPVGFPGAERPVEPLAFDPVAARSALGLAGFVSGSELPPVTLTYDRGDRDLEHVAQALQRDWRETLGIEVTLDPVDVTTLIERLNVMADNPSDAARTMQMYISVWGADYPDPQNFISLQLHSQSPYNNGHWSSAEFDRLVEQADQQSGSGSRDERLKLYRDAEQIAVREVGWLPLYSPAVTLAIRPTVRGLVATSTPQGIVAADWTRVRIANE